MADQEEEAVDAEVNDTTQLNLAKKEKSKCCLPVCCNRTDNGDDEEDELRVLDELVDAITNDELTGNVDELREKFDKLIEKYSAYEDRLDNIFTVDEDELRLLFKGLSIDSYGVLLWIMCMDSLETQNQSILWIILQFLCMRMPTQMAYGLMEHYSSQFARFNTKDIDKLGRALVNGSQFPLATCLILSAFFQERSKTDLSQEAVLLELSKDYAIEATTILDEIENDYLAVIMLETASIHDELSPLDIALEHDILEFLSCNKVSRISHAIWVSNEVMRVDTEDNAVTDAFALRNIGIDDIHSALLVNSYDFYFSSIGYFTVELTLYVIYLGLFTYLTFQLSQIDDNLKWIDYLFWIFNLGYVFNEIIEVSFDGVNEYFSKWQNWLDFGLSVNFIVIICLRIWAKWINDLSVGPNEPLSVFFKVVWVANVIMLWLRVLHFMMLSSSEGPIVTNIKNMLSDIYSFTKIYGVILFGFLFGLSFLMQGTHPLFISLQATGLTLFKTTLGELEWECLRPYSGEEDDCECDFGCDNSVNETRTDVAEIALGIFTIGTLIVYFNLLTAMMATTFRLISEGASKEVLTRKVSIGHEYDRSSQVMPPPFNAIVLVVFVVYNALDFVLLLIFQKFLNESFGSLQWKCKNCLCLNTYDKNVGTCRLCGAGQLKIDPKRRFLRHPRGITKEDGCCAALVAGWREVFGSNVGSSWKEIEPIVRKKDWICGYCRNRVPPNIIGDVTKFENRLQSHGIKVDEDDIISIEALRPNLCPICYRIINIRTRLIFILEVLSYLVFLFLLYPIIRILLIPIHVWQFLVFLFGKCFGDDGHTKDEDEEKEKQVSKDEAPKQVQKVMPTGDYHQSLLKRRHSVWSTLNKYQRKQKIIKNNTIFREAKEKFKIEDAQEAKTLNAIQKDMKTLVDKFLNEKIDRSVEMQQDDNEE